LTRTSPVACIAGPYIRASGLQWEVPRLHFSQPSHSWRHLSWTLSRAREALSRVREALSRAREALYRAREAAWLLLTIIARRAAVSAGLAPAQRAK